MHKKMSKQTNTMLTVAFFAAGATYLWFVSSAVFA